MIELIGQIGTLVIACMGNIMIVHDLRDGEFFMPYNNKIANVKCELTEEK